MELEFKMQEWTYRTLPNKMYELVHNTGDLHKQGTGYLTDAESEMLTILNYLNFGEKTSITESMIAQIDKAIRDSAITGLNQDENALRKRKHMPVSEFVTQMTDVAKTNVGVVYFKEENDSVDYTVDYYEPQKEKISRHFSTLVDSRKYLEKLGCSVRMASRTDDASVIETWI